MCLLGTRRLMITRNRIVAMDAELMLFWGAFRRGTANRLFQGVRVVEEIILRVGLDGSLI